jgi:hypothetical protein
MGPALMAAGLLAAALRVALLPAETTGVPAEAVKAGAQALQRSLPAPWAEAKLDQAALAEHLAAAGPACRTDLVCLCSVAPFEEGALALDLRVSSLAPLKGWTADLRLVEPCAGKVVDRRSVAVEATPAALARFAAEAAGQLLRGRDLPGIRWTGKAGLTVVPEPARPVPPKRSAAPADAE